MVDSIAVRKDPVGVMEEKWKGSDLCRFTEFIRQFKGEEAMSVFYIFLAWFHASNAGYQFESFICKTS